MKKNKARTQQAKQKIFEQIELLLDENDLDHITFSQIAHMCGCQPNSISYYFSNKMQMLLEFVQYFLEKDTLYQSALSFVPSALHPVEGFCQEIDKIFSSSEQKSKIRLLSNYFLIVHANHSDDFKKYLNQSIEKEVLAYRNMLKYYQSMGILCEERLHSTYVELCFQASAFSLLYIFRLPVWDYSLQVHNVKEHLKAAFLKDGLYIERLLDPELEFLRPDHPENTPLEKPFAPDTAYSALQTDVFQIIANLLNEGRIKDITFSYLAEHCFCQTSSIAYYFKSKMDMLLQFTQYHLNRIYSRAETFEYFPPEGLSDVEAFSQYIKNTLSGAYERSETIYWINYLVICNATANPDFYNYLSFSIQGKLKRYWKIVQYYNNRGILNQDTLLRNFCDLCFFGDTLALIQIFQIPVIDKDYFLEFIYTRMKTGFLKPEFLPRTTC